MDNNRENYSDDNNSDGVLKCGYNRNSFDRFGDDLCEEVLQYLSFEDKIRFECVSKQWKCCVYQRQYILEICHIKRINSLHPQELCDIASQPNNKGLEDNETISNLERLLQKCRKINRINIGNDYYRSMENFDIMLRIISNNCVQIVSLKLRQTVFNDLQQICENIVKDLVSKCGNTLRTIDLNGSYYKHLLGLCPNIVSISNIKLNELIDANSDVILAPKLSIIKKLIVSDDFQLMNRFVNRYCDTIRVFDAIIFHIVNYLDFMSQLSQLNNLENLSLTLNTYEITSDFIDNGFENFATIRGKQVKHLYLRFESEFDYFYNTRLLAIICNNFTELKSLRIKGLCDSRHNRYGDISFELIKTSEIKLSGNYLSNDLMYRFLARNCNKFNIEVIDAWLHAINNYDKFMSQLSKFKKLESLSLNVSLSGTSKFLKCFRNFAKCGGKQIRHLSLKFQVGPNKLKYLELFRIVNNFTEIQSLRISGPYDNQCDMELASFIHIQSCIRLTHLELEEFIDDKCFVDIDKYLPQLTVIKLESNNNINITDQTIESLSKLIHLKELHITLRRCGRSKSKFSHKTISNLLESCEHFKSLNIDNCPHIERETILKFVEIAKIRAHINFDHRFNFSFESEQRRLFKSTIERISGGLPHNLKITY